MSRLRAGFEAAVVVTLAASCSQPAPVSEPASQAPQASMQRAATAPRVTLPDGFLVNVEVAFNDETRAQGLMYRDSMPEDRGMLFLFPQPGLYPFWMKNTLIALDIVWIDATGTVIHIETVPPCPADPCPSYGPGTRAASFVLETAAGVAGKHDVRPGAVVRIAGVENITAQ